MAFLQLCIAQLKRIRLNPIPTGHGRNQPIYERHVTKSGRNRVKKDVQNNELQLENLLFMTSHPYFYQNSEKTNNAL